MIPIVLKSYGVVLDRPVIFNDVVTDPIFVSREFTSVGVRFPVPIIL